MMIKAEVRVTWSREPRNTGRLSRSWEGKEKDSPRGPPEPSPANLCGILTSRTATQ